MRIDYDELSTIRITAEVIFHDFELFSTHQFEWVGESDIVAITFELLEDGDPDLLPFCGRDEIFLGDTAQVGPYELKMIGVNYAKSLIYCERI